MISILSCNADSEILNTCLSHTAVWVGGTMGCYLHQSLSL